MHTKLLQSYPTLCDPVNCSLLLCPGDSPGKNTGVDCHVCLWGSFSTARTECLSQVSPAMAASSLPLALTGKPMGSRHHVKNACSIF